MLAIRNNTEEDGTIACTGAAVIFSGAFSLLPVCLSLRLDNPTNCCRFAVRGMSLDDVGIAEAVAKTAQQKEQQQVEAIQEHCSAAISKLVTQGELYGLSPAERHDYCKQKQDDFTRKLVARFKDLKTMRAAGALAKGDVFRQVNALRVVTGTDRNGIITTAKVPLEDYPQNAVRKGQRVGHNRKVHGILRNYFVYTVP